MGVKQLIMFTRKLTVILEKPKHKDEAHNMLRKSSTNCLAAFSIVYFLQVKWQDISSTYWLVKKSMNETKLHCFHEQSEVTFGEEWSRLMLRQRNHFKTWLIMQFIFVYLHWEIRPECTLCVDMQEVSLTLSYGIQVLGGTLIKRINGDNYNVEGLPLYKLCIKLHNQLKVWAVISK